MPTQPRKQTRLPRAQRHAQLLGVAHDVFAQRGYHATSMDDIAQAAGVSKPVLYQHFPGKRELYLDLLDSELARLLSTITDAVRTPTENRDRVAATIGAFFEMVAQDAFAHRLVFSSDLANDPEVSQRIAAFQTSIAEEIGAVIEAQAGLPHASAVLLGHALGGAAQSAAAHWQTSPNPDQETASALVSRLAWRGIGGFPQAGQPNSA
ncbi:MAG: TetR/AcrR family transcriptional regulator [Galactobacter sp.]